MSILQHRYFVPGAVAGGIVSVLFMLIVFLTMQDLSGQNGTQEITEVEQIDYAEEIVEDFNLFSDSRPVLVQVGIPGSVEHTYRVRYDRSGNEAERELIKSEILIEVQDRIIREGRLDREETLETVRRQLDTMIAAMRTEDYQSLYPLLAEQDRRLYSQENIQKSAKAIGFRIDTTSINGDIQFEYPDYLTESDQSLRPVIDAHRGEESTSSNSPSDTSGNHGKSIQRLTAVIPLSVAFESSAIGYQEVNVDVRLHHETNGWRVRYFGPSEVIPLNLSRTREDGGKTFGEPVSAEVTINNMVIFPYLDRVYFDYLIRNTSIRNFTNATQETIVPTDAFIARATLYDDPGTDYQLGDNVLFNQGGDAVWVGREAEGRMLFFPAPGPEINKVFLSVQLVITDKARYSNIVQQEMEMLEFISEINFGEVPLTRLHRQAQQSSSSNTGSSTEKTEQAAAAQ